MLNPAQRRRFQIHLSTAMVMMFVAGVLMWPILEFPERTTDVYGNDNFSYGWPLLAMTTWKHRNFDGWEPKYLPSNRGDSEISYVVITVDALVAFAILFVVWFLCEWQIRRHAARKGT